MKKITLFNHKGGVGKTTLTINIADALVTAGKTVLLVDADPQCNLTSFYLEEQDIEQLLKDSDDNGLGETLWSGVKRVVEGRGDIVDITAIELTDKKLHLLPGDVLLSEYEEALPQAWTESFARSVRGYAVTTALARLVAQKSEEVGADVVLYDVGPNVGGLNRVVLLDCDYFITPVAADLFSLRALSTVGRAIVKWTNDWTTVRKLASRPERGNLLPGKLAYMGYITSAFKVRAGRNATNPHADWENKIAPRVKLRIVDELKANTDVTVPTGPNKIGGIKHFHSLAPEAQRNGIAIGSLRGYVGSGNYPQVDEARAQFANVTREIMRRGGL